ncbi:MAG TPA: rod shape-determining protein MreC [Spirochaetia bacterium]|nr:rod shape-determining protein MreC [Spirochaetia bacterium]
MQFRNFTTRHRTVLTLAICVVFSLVSMSFSTKSFVLRPKDVGLSLFSLVQNGMFQVGGFFSRTVTSIKELGDLRRNYAILLSRVRQYEGIENDIVELRNENNRLRSLLGFSGQISYSNIAAQIIGKDPGNLFSSITIDKGSMDGIRKNMPVVAVQDGVQGLVGKIESVGLKSSIILPLYDHLNYVAARLQRTRFEGLVNGGGSENSPIVMRWVEKTAIKDIQTGDLVISSGMNSLYPKGIHIGTVTGITARPSDTSLELDIRPIIDFGRLEYVFVLQTDKPIPAPVPQGVGSNGGPNGGPNGG